MAEEFAGKVGLYVASKLVIPFFTWLGGRTVRGLAALQLSQGQSIALTFAGIGGVTYLTLPGNAERSFDFILGSIATVTNTSAQILGIAANQLRALEKADMEAYLNRQVDFLTPYFQEGEVLAIENKNNRELVIRPVNTTNRQVNTTQVNITNATSTFLESEEEEIDTENKNRVLAIAAPPPLLPKDYTMENFPYYTKRKFKVTHIGDPDVDPLIDAYATLGINIVSMILTDHQLPQMKLVKAIYLEQIKLIHPDRNIGEMSFEEANQKASMINQAYTRIKNLMKSADDQADFITPVLQYFHKGYFPPTPYIILFFMGGAFAIFVSALT